MGEDNLQQQQQQDEAAAFHTDPKSYLQT